MINFFDDRPLRIENFRSIQEELNLPAYNFVKHVSSRWLTLQDASKRLIEQWKAIMKYFLEYIPLRQNNTLKSKQYQDIVELIKMKNMKAQVLFVSSSVKIFNRFTGTFQKSEPLIHILYDELKRLGKTPIGKICKHASIKKFGLVEKVLESENLLLAKDIKLDDEVEVELSQLDETIQLEIKIRPQKHFVVACKHMLQKSAINNDVKYCQCLQAEQRRLS
ncbi:uncharacterized protein LOC122499674 [Leptopilina heterotoma]|uniref:uncharacterized protein LOC122499674 n=1 Tax=Leptopilina heterotoma TaxID=63436 RepID=UPI001CA96EFA|nr:uncharacterized protein LOC122499674 [Leptopilina heterotoma]